MSWFRRIPRIRERAKVYPLHNTFTPPKVLEEKKKEEQKTKNKDKKQ